MKLLAFMGRGRHLNGFVAAEGKSLSFCCFQLGGLDETRNYQSRLMQLELKNN
jgi:hypothetical protein